MEFATLAPWVGFIIGLGALLAFDLFVVHRNAHVIGVREATLWSAFWIGLALAFAGGLFLVDGSDQGTAFLTGYVIEKSLSVDNVFIFLIIFQYFAVPPILQPKVLHWGILGALSMRLILILIGTALLSTFHWMIFIFGSILILSAGKLAFQKEHEVHPERNPLIRLMKRFVPMSDQYDGGKFFVRRNAVLMATPLFAVLLIVESTDLIFAVDSIPAVLTISRDPFIVFTSNAFAILGLRALYFAMAGVMNNFVYLRQGLVVILGYVGVKMILSEWYKIPTGASLAVIASILTIAVVASLIATKRHRRTEEESTYGHEVAHKPYLTGKAAD